MGASGWRGAIVLSNEQVRHVRVGRVVLEALDHEGPARAVRGEGEGVAAGRIEPASDDRAAGPQDLDRGALAALDVTDAGEVTVDARDWGRLPLRDREVRVGRAGGEEAEGE